MAITLPLSCVSKEAAQELVTRNYDTSLYIDAIHNKHITQDFVNGLMKSFINLKLDRVTVMNLTEATEDFFMHAFAKYRGQFILEFINK